MRILITSLLIALASPVLAQDPRPQIIVTAEGRVDSAPDMATVSAGVTTEGKTAAEALAANTAAMNAVFERLKSAGIAEKDIQTTNLSVNPVWNSSKSSLSGGPEISGYTANNMVTVHVRDMEAIGKVLDLVVTDGANNLNGLFFGLQNPDPALDEARLRAVTEAGRRAKLLADAAGVTLGPVLSITEGGSYNDPLPMYRAEMAMEKSVPVAGGQVSTNVSVTIVYGIMN